MGMCSWVWVYFFFHWTIFSSGLIFWLCVGKMRKTTLCDAFKLLPR